MPIPPYGVAIQQAVASGDLITMKRVAAEAETYLKEHGDVAAALEALRAEISRHERKSS